MSRAASSSPSSPAFARTMSAHSEYSSAFTPPLIRVAGEASDEELGALLRAVYVDGGYTEPEAAETLFAGSAVRARGTLITARDSRSQSLLGMVILVPPEAATRQIARGSEAEVHLLAVAPAVRGRGIGLALVKALIATASKIGCEQLVLSTQETMHAAHAVYERAGFERTPDRDWARAGRRFLSYWLSLE